MKNSLAFKYTTDFSRELDDTGVKIDDEIRVEMVERSTAHMIAEGFKPILDIIGGSAPRAGSWSRRNAPLLLFLLFIPIDILRWTLTNPLDDLGELSSSRHIFYGDDIDLMPPVVAKVEPVSESITALQPKRSDGRPLYVPCGRVFIIVNVERIPPRLWVHRPLAANLELIHMIIFPVESIEDRIVQNLQSLISANLNGSGDHPILPHEPVSHWSADDKHI